MNRTATSVPNLALWEREPAEPVASVSIITEVGNGDELGPLPSYLNHGQIAEG